MKTFLFNFSRLFYFIFKKTHFFFDSPFAKRHAAAENTTLLEGAENYALEGIKRRLIRIGQSGVLPKVLGQDVSGVLLQSYSSTTEDTIAVLPRLSPLDACRMVLSPDEGLTTRYISLGEVLIYSYCVFDLFVSFPF